MKTKARASTAVSLKEAASLALECVEKSYGPTRALRGVTVASFPGEVHAIIGENGSGKSTLLKIASGETRPDHGRILVNGAPVRFRQPRDALSWGIALIPQEVPLCSSLTVAENISLGALPGRAGRVDWRTCRRTAVAVLAELGERFDVSRDVRSLTADERQIVAIARALARGQRTILFDEPTSSLSLDQANRLFSVLAELRRTGITMIYVTQRLAELREVADRVTVLRDGEVVGALGADDIDEPRIAELMTGRVLERHVQAEDAALDSARDSPGLLVVEGLSMPPQIASVSIAVSAGEVVGLAGLVGSGAPDVLEALAGIRSGARGVVRLGGRHLPLSSVRATMSRGVGYLPRDRGREALVPNLSITENLLLPELASIWPVIVSKRKQKLRAVQLARAFSVKAASMEAEAGSLSGGNQQKLIVARVLANNPRLLLLNEPTRGVDVGAKTDIFQAIREFASGDRGALVYSSEFKDLIEWCDRIVVLHRGRVVTELSATLCSEEQLIRLASRGGAISMNDSTTPRYRGTGAGQGR